MWKQPNNITIWWHSKKDEVNSILFDGYNEFFVIWFAVPIFRQFWKMTDRKVHLFLHTVLIVLQQWWPWPCWSLVRIHLYPWNKNYNLSVYMVSQVLSCLDGLKPGIILDVLNLMHACSFNFSWYAIFFDLIMHYLPHHNKKSHNAPAIHQKSKTPVKFLVCFPGNDQIWPPPADPQKFW